MAIARMANIIRVLSAHSLPLTDAVLLDGYEWAIEQNVEVKDILRDDMSEALVAAIAYR